MKIPKPQNIAKCLSFLFFCFLEKDNSNIMSFHSWIKSGSTEHLSWLPPLLRARRQSQPKRLRTFILVLCPGQEISNVRHFSTIILQPSEPPPAKGALHPAVATVGGPHQWAFSATEKRVPRLGYVKELSRAKPDQSSSEEIWWKQDPVLARSILSQG